MECQGPTDADGNPYAAAYAPGSIDCHPSFGGTGAPITEDDTTGQISFAVWNSGDSALSRKRKIVPVPAHYRRSFRRDFITCNGDPSDPAGPTKNWSCIGKSTWDGHQMFFAVVRLEVYNAIGQHVGVFAKTEFEAGNHRITWHGTDGDGRPLTAGVYLARMETKDFPSTVKMLLLK